MGNKLKEHSAINHREEENTLSLINYLIMMALR